MPLEPDTVVHVFLRCCEFFVLVFFPPLTNKLVTKERCLFTANSDPSLLTAAASK